METPTTIAGHRVLESLGGSKRFEAFRVELPNSARGRATLYVMAEPVTHSDMFVELANAVRASWPFHVTTGRDYILPEAQLWQDRPWFVVPDSLPVVASLDSLAADARAALRAQLSWLSEFTHPWVDDVEFGHGDLRAPRVALIGDAEPVMIAPGWVAASDLARGRGLVDARVDDAWHLARLLAGSSSASGKAAEVAPRQNGVHKPAPVAAAPKPAAAAPVAAAPRLVMPEAAPVAARVSQPISSEPAPLLTFEPSTSDVPISEPPLSQPEPSFAQPAPPMPAELEHDDVEELEAEIIPSQAPSAAPGELRPLELSTARTPPVFPIGSMPPPAFSVPPAAARPGPPPYVPPQNPSLDSPFNAPQPPPAEPVFAATSLPNQPQPAPYAPNIPPLTVGQQPAGGGSTKWIIIAVTVIGVVLAVLALLR
jgi:hypothetical protein